jgi:hypothetical protein
MAHTPDPGFRDQFPRLPNPRFIAVLIVVAALVLGVGASLGPGAQPAAVVVPTNELATLPERSQRRALRDIAEYVTERSGTLGASVVFLPQHGTSGLVVGPDSVLSVVKAATAGARPAAEPLRAVLAPRPAIDSAAPVAPVFRPDTIRPRWSLVVARQPSGRLLTLSGMTGGIIEGQCGGVVFPELVFDAVVPPAFAGGAVFELDGRAMALVVPCGARTMLVPVPDLLWLLRLQTPPAEP